MIDGGIMVPGRENFPRADVQQENTHSPENDSHGK
jgi:hypothetical protein